MLGDLDAVLDQVCGNAASFSDADSIVALHRCLARLEAATAVATASFDATGEWGNKGARSCASWVSIRCGMAKSVASRELQVGKTLRHLRVAEAAWLSGDVGTAQVQALVSARNPVTEAAMARDEQMLVAQAKDMGYVGFRHVLAYWSQHADPDGAEDSAEDQRAARKFHLSQTFKGTWVGDLALDPISGAVVSNQLNRIVEELFEADWAEMKARLGNTVQASELRRTPAQRRADGLVEMARRAGTVAPNGRRPEPLFSVYVGYETLAGRICQLADGTVVSPGSLAPWLNEAWIERVVFDTPSRVIDVGVTRRLYSGATRRAVQLRDRTCFHELCDLPAEGLEVDHIEPWAAGGRTTAANGRPACGHHNRGRNRGP